jgi:phytoene dehydrogenase-like protein
LGHLETNHFDVIVCGGHTAGLIAAALLGRRGMRVLLCGVERPKSTFVAGDYTLCSDPGLVPPPDAESIARVLRDLNHLQVVRQRSVPIVRGLQLVVGDQTIELGEQGPASEEPAPAVTDVAAVLERLRQTSARLDPLLGSDLPLPPEGFWDRREVARVEAKLPNRSTDLLAPLAAHHPVRVGLHALASLSCQFAPTDLGAVVQARAYDVSRRGIFSLDGGTVALRTLFLEKLAASSADLREKVAPVELIFRRGRFSSMRVQPRDEMIGFDHLVWADGMSSLLRFCGDRASRKLRELADHMRPACYRYTLCLLVRSEALPAGFGPRVIAVANPLQPVLEENALSIVVGPGKGVVPLWVECLVPAAAALGGGYLAVVRARVREKLRKLLPGLDDNLLVLASPHDGLSPELPRRTAEPLPSIPMTPVFSFDLARTLGVGGATYSTGMKNVYLVGDETLPGLGREGDFLAGWGVARVITAQQPRRALQRREILIDGA